MNLSPHNTVALLLVLCLATFGPVSAQSFDWFQSLESNETEGYRDVWALALHGDAVYVAARIELVKYDIAGNELWRRAPDTGFERQELFGVVANALGSYAAGRAQTPAGRSVGILQMFDHAGAVRGTVSFEDEIDEIWELALTDDALFVYGNHYANGATLARLTLTGDVEWIRPLGGGSPSALTVGGGLVYAVSGSWGGSGVHVFDLGGHEVRYFDLPSTIAWIYGLEWYDGSLYLLGTGTAARLDLAGNLLWQHYLWDWWHVDGIAVGAEGVYVGVNSYDPSASWGETPSVSVLHIDFDGQMRELWTHHGVYMQPATLAVDEGGVFLGGLWSEERYYGGFAAKLHLVPRYARLTWMADANGNGTAELAAMRTLVNGATEVVVTDSVTKQEIRRLRFELEGAEAIDLTGILDLNGNGTSEIAVLFRKPSGQGIVQLRDAGTGAWIHQMAFFGRDWTVDALVDLDLDGDSYSEIAVLAALDDIGLDGSRTVGVQVRQAMTGWQVAWVGFPDAYTYRAMRDVARVEDMNGDGRPELAVLYGEDTIAGSAEFTIKDLLTKRVLGQGTHVYPESPEPPRRPIAIAGLDYASPAAAPGVGILFDKPNGQGILEVFDAATGGWTDDIFFVGANWSVLDVASPPSSAAARSQVGVLAVDHETGMPGVQIKDVETGSQVRWVGFPVE